MKVVGICGSPRREGNAEHLLRAALEPFRERGWETVAFLLCERTVAPCRACEICQAGGGCAIRDDMDALYEALGECDALLVATPVYYRNVSAQLKAVFDRCYAVRASQPLQGKPGGAIAVGRGTGGGQGLALAIIYNWLLSSGAICVPGELNGVSAVADKPGDILSQPERLRQARVLGENVLHCAEALGGARLLTR